VADEPTNFAKFTFPKYFRIIISILSILSFFIINFYSHIISDICLILCRLEIIIASPPPQRKCSNVTISPHHTNSFIRRKGNFLNAYVYSFTQTI
jgi:hypothetical protein